MKRLSILLFAAAIFGAFLSNPGMAVASDKADAQAIVTKANITFNSFMSDKILHGDEEAVPIGEGHLHRPAGAQGRLRHRRLGRHRGLPRS